MVCPKCRSLYKRDKPHEKCPNPKCAEVGAGTGDVTSGKKVCESEALLEWVREEMFKPDHKDETLLPLLKQMAKRLKQDGVDLPVETALLLWRAVGRLNLSRPVLCC